MSELVYAALEAVEVSGERPTLHLRWNNGVLEQKWEREIYSPKPSITHDWRPVQATNDAPAPSQKPLVSAPANPSGREALEPIGYISVGTMASLEKFSGLYRIAAPKWGGPEETEPLYTAVQLASVEQERDRWLDAAQTTSQSLTAAEAQISALQARIQGLEEALKSIISDAQGASVCGEAENGLEAIFYKATEALSEGA